MCHACVVDPTLNMHLFWMKCIERTLLVVRVKYKSEHCAFLVLCD